MGNRFLASLRLVWFSTFTIFWCVILLTKDDNLLVYAFLFLGHIFTTAVCLHDFVENMNKKE
jgi:hypothetical protein